MTATEGLLPTASRRRLLDWCRRTLADERAGFSALILLQAGATLAGLVGPWALGAVVQAATRDQVGRVVLPVLVAFGLATVVRSGLSWLARRRAGVLGAGILARLRQEFMDNVLQLPLGAVEQAGTGDLLTRSTADVDELSRTVQRALPDMAIALVTVVLTVAGLVWTAPILGATLVPAVVILVPVARWYLRRAPAAYLREREASGQVNGLLQESVDAGRSVEAFRLGPRRISQVDGAVADWVAAERATLRLRTVFWPASEATYLVPLVLSVLLGGLLHLAGLLSIGALTAAALYTQQLIDPVDVILSWLDELQLGAAALSRLLGVGDVPRTEPTELVPEGVQMAADRVRFSYRSGHDVLRGLNLRPEPGSRIAIVGPSGSGKTTFGLLLAGVLGPREGRVTVGQVDVHRLEPDRLRREVVLLTQEHHVFSGSLRDNLRLASPQASDAQLRQALHTVDALEWADRLPEALDSPVGSGGAILSPAQAQQVALARLVLADPHTLVLDEATSLINPRAARRLERTLARVLEGRTVVAVSHRLHAASDADLVVVMSDGKVVEAGQHHDLLDSGGKYAELWAAFHQGMVAAES